MLLYELEELDDILETLIFEDEPSIFDEENALELYETIFHLTDCYIEEHPHAISEPDFYDTLLEEIQEILYIQMEDHILAELNNDFIEDDMNDLIEEALHIYLTTFYQDRSIEQKHHENNYDEDEIDIIEEKIQCLRDLPQPVQRTPEWYQFRWNLITASNAWKAFESQSTINQLIYEKCQPLKDLSEVEEDVKMVNVNSPLHWGQKFEPLSVLIYERDYNTKVEDFGCIQHPIYKFIGASPDGIVVDVNSDRYGRMLEIKNVVSREINGIPKKEYWVQMQLQMEVCDLDECDFLETKFVEYNDYNEYLLDTSMDTDKKGIIIYFHTKEGKPFYSYKPLDITEESELLKWEDEILDLYQSDKYNYTFLKFIYWKLEKLSCVLVLRNKEWFKNNIGQLEKVWKIIEEERVTGYEHRGPVKKTKKDSINKPFIDNKESQGCLLNYFNKIVKIDPNI